MRKKWRKGIKMMRNLCKLVHSQESHTQIQTKSPTLLTPPSL